MMDVKTSVQRCYCKNGEPSLQKHKSNLLHTHTYVYAIIYIDTHTTHTLIYIMNQTSFADMHTHTHVYNIGFKILKCYFNWHIKLKNENTSESNMWEGELQAHLPSERIQIVCNTVIQIFLKKFNFFFYNAQHKNSIHNQIIKEY